MLDRDVIHRVDKQNRVDKHYVIIVNSTHRYRDFKTINITLPKPIVRYIRVKAAAESLHLIYPSV